MKDKIIQSMVKTVHNHMARAAEGRALLQQGKSLREMQTPIIGPTPDQNYDRRTDFLKTIQGYNDTKLIQVYHNYMFQLKRRAADPDAGTSEYYWQRIAFLDEFERRGISPP